MGILAFIMPIAHFFYGVGAFWYGFMIMALAGVFNGISTVAIFGIAGYLPFRYMGAIMLG